MTCSVVTEKPGGPPSEMEDGDLAVILTFRDYPHFVGRVIQRGSGESLFVLGRDWSGRFDNGVKEGVRVRILHSGDTIRID